MSLQFRVAVLVLVPLLVLVAVVLVVEPSRVRRANLAAAVQHAERTANVLGAALSDAYARREAEALGAALASLARDPDVSSAEVRDAAAHLVASTPPAPASGTGSFEVRAAIPAAGPDAGELRITWSLATVEAADRSHTATARLVAACILLLGIPGAFAAASLLVARISVIADAAQAVADHSAPLAGIRAHLGEGHRDSRDEAERLTDALGRIARRVARLYREVDSERVRADGAEAVIRDLSAAKAHFLAVVSHELRTPLSAIIGYAELLRELVAEEGRTDLAGDLDRIHGAGCHLLALVNDILDLSKIEAGNMEVHLERADLDDAVRQVQGAVEPLISRNANLFVVNVPEVLGTAVVDVRKFQQCLLNLLGNAARFTRDGEVELSVRIEDDWLVARVRDTGIGMSSEQMDQLFQALVQPEPAATTRALGGTGLGLALTRQLATILGGEIAVTSELGRGTTFTLRLPFGSARVAPV